MLIEVGKKFEFFKQLPSSDGIFMEMSADGLINIVVKMNNIDDVELSALKQKFNRFAYNEFYKNSITLASFVFKFPAPVCYMDAIFHAGLYTDNRANKFIDSKSNAFHFFVVDGEILKAMWISGMEDKPMELFHATVKKQIKEKIDLHIYNQSVNMLFNLTPEDIFRTGKTYKHGL